MRCSLLFVLLVGLAAIADISAESLEDSEEIVKVAAKPAKGAKVAKERDAHGKAAGKSQKLAGKESSSPDAVASQDASQGVPGATKILLATGASLDAPRVAGTGPKSADNAKDKSDDKSKDDYEDEFEDESEEAASPKKAGRRSRRRGGQDAVEDRVKRATERDETRHWASRPAKRDSVAALLEFIQQLLNQLQYCDDNSNNGCNCCGYPYYPYYPYRAEDDQKAFNINLGGGFGVDWTHANPPSGRPNGKPSSNLLNFFEQYWHQSDHPNGQPWHQSDHPNGQPWHQSDHPNGEHWSQSYHPFVPQWLLAHGFRNGPGPNPNQGPDPRKAQADPQAPAAPPQTPPDALEQRNLEEQPEEGDDIPTPLPDGENDERHMGMSPYHKGHNKGSNKGEKGGDYCNYS